MDRTTATALKAVTLVVVILLAVLAAYALGGLRSSARAGDEAITLSGNGSVTIVPDRASVKLGVEVTRPGAATALEDASKLQTKVIAALKAAGIEDKYVRTGSISVNPRWDYRDGQERIDGYTARQTVKVTITDLEKVGEVLGAAADEGGNAIRIDDFHLYSSDKDDATKEAREEAVKDAREKAEQLAKAGDRELGKMLRIEEHGDISRSYGDNLDGLLATRAQASFKEAPVEPGEQKVNITVKVVWELR